MLRFLAVGGVAIAQKRHLRGLTGWDRKMDDGSREAGWRGGKNSEM